MADGVSGLSVTVQLGEAETYDTTLPSGSVADAPFQDHLVNGVSPNGTTINLFDYWLTGRTDSDNEDPWPSGTNQDPTLQNYGINANHALVFSAKHASNNRPYFGDWNTCGQVLWRTYAQTAGKGGPQLTGRGPARAADVRRHGLRAYGRTCG